MQCGSILHSAAKSAGAPHDLAVLPRSRFSRIDLPATAAIQEVFRHLVQGLARTEAIGAEITLDFEQSRKVLALTERTEHLDAIHLALAARVPPRFALHGRVAPGDT